MLMVRLKGEGERRAAAIRAGLSNLHFPSLLGEFQAFLCTFCAFYHTFEIASQGGRAERGESAADPKMQTWGMREICLKLSWD